MHCAISLCTDDWFNVETPHWIPFISFHHLSSFSIPCSILHPWATCPGDCPVWGLCLWPSMVQPPTSQQRPQSSVAVRKFVIVCQMLSVVPLFVSCYFAILRLASKELNLMSCFRPSWLSQRAFQCLSLSWNWVTCSVISVQRTWRNPES